MRKEAHRTALTVQVVTLCSKFHNVCIVTVDFVAPVVSNNQAQLQVTFRRGQNIFEEHMASICQNRRPHSICSTQVVLFQY